MTTPTQIEEVNVEFLVICDYACATPDGKLTMVGAFEVINAPRVPLALPAMGIAARLRDKRPNGHRGFTVRMKGPDGSTVVNLDGDFATAAGNPRPEIGTTFPIAIMMGNVIFAKYGEYRVEIWIDKRRAQALSIHVVKPAGATASSQLQVGGATVQ